MGTRALEHRTSLAGARLYPGRKRVEASFSAKADRYDENASLQERIGRRLAALIEREGGLPQPCADLGCGTGRLHVTGGAPGRVVGIDLSMEMLGRFRRAVAGGMPVRADVEVLPLGTACLGAAILGLVLQWTEEPRRAVREAARCLRAGGVLAFSALLGGTLRDLYDLAREKGRAIPVALPEREELCAMLSGEGLDLFAAEPGEEVQHFPGAREALRSLSAVGAAATGARPMTRPEVADFCGEYERRTRQPQGVPLSWAFMVGLARKRD